MSDEIEIQKLEAALAATEDEYKRTAAKAKQLEGQPEAPDALQELSRVALREQRLRDELDQLKAQSNPDNVVHDKRFAWWEHNEARTAQRQEDASRAHKYYACNQRGQQLYEAHKRKLAQEAAEARRQAEREQEAAEEALRNHFIGVAMQEYDAHMATRAAAEREHADYEREERARATALRRARS
jgi:hypothetical protein